MALTRSSSPFNSSKIPIEVWENVIDFVAAELTLLGGRADLLACCLTCHSWVPRCRFYLLETITLRSASALSHVVNLLSSSPTLCARVMYLVVVGTPSTAQTWISLIPIRLGPLLKSISGITLQGVDLSLRHHDFYKGWMLFRPLTYMVLTRVHYTRYSQLSRLASATHAQEFCIQDDSDGHIGEERRNAISPSVRLGRLSLCTSHLLSLEMVLTWEKLDTISRDYWKIFGPQLMKIRIRSEGYDQPEGGVRSLQWGNIVNMFQQLCLHAVATFVEVKITVGVYTVTLSKSDKWGWTAPVGQRSLHVDIMATNSPGDYVSTVAHLLTCLSLPQFSVVGLTFHPSDSFADYKSESWTPIQSTSLSQHLYQKWRCMDDAFAGPNYANLTDLCVRLGLHAFHLPQTHQYRNDLYPELLPMLAVRNVPVQFYASRGYLYHELREAQENHSA